MITKQIIELTEYKTKRLAQEDFSQKLAEYLWRNHGNQITIEFPNPMNDWQWCLTNQGWVGYIPIKNELTIALKPKVPIYNVFGMLEYAYNLKSLSFSKDYIHSNSIQDFFNVLANILAKQILNRVRKGLYKSYQDRNEKLTYVCGKIEFNEHLRKPWDPRLECHYQNCTPDIEDNQILLWTLYIIIRSGLCNLETSKLIHQTYRNLQRVIQVQPFTAIQCKSRFYNRLNLDYQVMHHLCCFFLEHCGPQFSTGKQISIPFLVNMPNLYEMFVAEWLKMHLPQKYELRAQERVNIGADNMLYFVIDLVIYDNDTGETLYVLDTKYKITEGISPADFSQVVTYALAKNCSEAVLVYPWKSTEHHSGYIHNIRVRSLPFKIDGDLEEAGTHFLEELFEV